jgi:hypothetical protein
MMTNGQKNLLDRIVDVLIFAFGIILGLAISTLPTV